MERNPDSEADTSTRPNSSYTIDSTFADSAVDMDASASTTLPQDEMERKASKIQASPPPSPEPIDQTLSDKMRHLTAVAWALEQDGSIDVKCRRSLHKILHHLEEFLESANQESGLDQDEDLQSSTSDEDFETQDDSKLQRTQNQDEDEDEWIDEADLLAVQDNLAATVQSMRLRHQEQRHLHELTIHKIEAVAQRCIIQERQLQDMGRELKDLKVENQAINEDNDRLKTAVSGVQFELAKKEVAVSAMSSAVAGLEGWIESTQASVELSPAKMHRGRRQRVVVRGKGRFRGKYIVDEDGNDLSMKHGSENAVDSYELQDGVKAWVRGFRDVEEELRQSDTSDRLPKNGDYPPQDRLEEEDWGEFQSPRAYMK